MAWRELDKAAGLYLIVELGSHLTPEEVFKVLVQVGKMAGDRVDLKNTPRLRGKYAGLAACFRECVEKKSPLDRDVRNAAKK